MRPQQAIFLARADQRYRFVLAEPASCSSSPCETNDPTPIPSPFLAAARLQINSARERRKTLGREGDDADVSTSLDDAAVRKEEKGRGVVRESSRAEGGLRDGGSSGSTADDEKQDNAGTTDGHRETAAKAAAAAAPGVTAIALSEEETAMFAALAAAMDDTTDTAVSTVAVPATELSECNASVEGSGGTGDGDGGEPDNSGVGGDATEERRSSGHGAAGAGGVVSGDGDSAGVKPRGGWRIGEGLSVPMDGAHAVWSRFKAALEVRAAAAAVGGRRRHSSAAGKELVGEVLLEDRREAVLAAVRWAWKGYTTHAWGTDELNPLTRRGKTSFRLGLTIVDSMDTLWLAGEREEFARCLHWVTNVMDLDVDQNVNVFETTIRVLGGLLAAYHLSGEEALLTKAADLGRRLSKAFDSPSGIPYSDVNLRSGRAFNPKSSPGSSLSEATTLQLEFSYLTKLTGDPSFHEAAQRASDAVEEAIVKLAWGEKGRGERQQGLAPVFVDPKTGLFGESGGAVGSNRGLVTLGARGDSYYEYLLKQWLFSGKKDTKYLRRYQEAVRAVEATLLQKSYPGELWFVGELVGENFSPKMDHLVCFLPGTLALG
ncbi:unnamed protein product, partial [Ectocarpus fasciculatus]